MAEAEDKPKAHRGRPPIPDKEEGIHIRLYVKPNTFDKIEHWAVLCGFTHKQALC